MPRIPLFFLLALCLSACSMLGMEEPPQPGTPTAQAEPATSEPSPALASQGPAPVEVASLMLQGHGLAQPGLTDLDAQRQSAFTAALVDALGQGVPVDTEVMDLGADQGLRLLTGRGQFQGFSVLRQQVMLGGESLSRITVAGREDHLLVVRMGRMERMDPQLAPLFPNHAQAGEFVGLPVSRIDFGMEDGLVSCTVRLGGVPAADLPQEQGFDSLVVDSRFCTIGPTRLVRLLAPDGRELYGPNSLPGSLLVASGVAKFTTSYQKALVLLEAQGANNPLTVRCASSRSGADGQEALVLTEQGAEALAKADAQYGFLKQGRVVILTAP